MLTFRVVPPVVPEVTEKWSMVKLLNLAFLMPFFDKVFFLAS